MPTYSVCGFTALEYAEKKHFELRRQLLQSVGRGTAASLTIWEVEQSQLSYLRQKMGDYVVFLLINSAAESHLRNSSIGYRHLGYVQSAMDEPKGCTLFYRSPTS